MCDAGPRKRSKGNQTTQELMQNPKEQPLSGMCQHFAEYARQLDQTNERRERIVKASRDVTIQSKKVIFQLHRAPAANPSAAVEEAEKSLEVVRRSHLARIAQELQGTDYWKFRRAYTPGMQEHVEAAALSCYFKQGALLSLAELNRSLASLTDAGGQPFSATLEDYLLGLMDTTGELMRHAISSAASGQHDVAAAVRDFVRALHQGFSTLPSSSELGREMPKKREVMLQSLAKVENARYMLKVRGSEYPQDIFASRLEGHGDPDASDYGNVDG